MAKNRMPKGTIEKRTPASLGEFMKLEMRACEESVFASDSNAPLPQLTVTTVDKDQTRYPSVSPNAVRIFIISFVALMLISPGPTFSKKAASCTTTEAKYVCRSLSASSPDARETGRTVHERATRIG
jgi:hypothetical protein